MAADLVTGLLVHYTFSYYINPTTIADEQGVYNGTLYGSPVYSDGVLTCDGLNDYIVVGRARDLSNLSLASAVYFESPGGLVYAATEREASNPGQMYVAVNANGSATVMVYYTNTSPYYIYYSTPAGTVDVAHKYKILFNLNRQSNRLEIWLNGGLVYATNEFTYTFPMGRDVSNLLNIGRFRNFTYGTNYYPGVYDAFRVYDRFLTVEDCTELTAFYDYTVPITVEESLVASEFYAIACYAGNKQRAAEGVITSPSGSLPFQSAAPVYVTLIAQQGDVWAPAKNYALGDKCFPTDPTATPYYYKRIAAGNSGTTEPTWPTMPGAQVDDGAVTNAWELVERLIQPIIHGPLTPS